MNSTFKKKRLHKSHEKLILDRLRNLSYSKGFSNIGLTRTIMFEQYAIETKRDPPKKADRFFWAWDIYLSGTCKILCLNSIYKPEPKKKKDKPKKNDYKHFYIPSQDFFKMREWQSLRRSVLKKYGLRCMKCGVSRCELHVDHIFPRSKFPHLQFEFSNLHVLCRGCNMEKSNHHFTDYRQNKKSASSEAP